jgi:predicted metal-dependent HD superfamily phosphohydrolase
MNIERWKALLRGLGVPSFLDRPRIYHWEPLFERFERKARTNVSGAIRTLIGES